MDGYQNETLEPSRRVPLPFLDHINYVRALPIQLETLREAGPRARRLDR